MQYTAKAIAGPSNEISSPFPLQKPSPDLRFLNFLPLFFKGVFFHLGPIWNPVSCRILNQFLALAIPASGTVTTHLSS